MLKSNKILAPLLIAFMLIFILNPQVYMQSCLNGLTVWFYNVLPALFPFFIATRLLILLNINNIHILDKFCFKFFKTQNSGKIFMLSLISGYPIGAKLICDAYNQNQLDITSAKKMMSYCSVSGPMFIIGSVGLGIFNSLRFGYLLLLSHILGAIINGFVFKNCYQIKKHLNTSKSSSELNITNEVKSNNKSSNILADSMLDSISSILIVGGYIVFAFVLIDLLNNIKFIPTLSNVVCNLFNIENTNLVSCVFNGLLEMTKGLIGMGSHCLSHKINLVLASFLIGFGGISVFLQSLNFTKNLQIKKGFYLFQKLCQGCWSAIISLVLVNLL